MSVLESWNQSYLWTKDKQEVTTFFFFGLILYPLESKYWEDPNRNCDITLYVG